MAKKTERTLLDMAQDYPHSYRQDWYDGMSVDVWENPETGARAFLYCNGYSVRLKLFDGNKMKPGDVCIYQFSKVYGVEKWVLADKKQMKIDYHNWVHGLPIQKPIVDF